MYEFGTTSAQLAEIKVAASQHAQHNPNALLQNPVTVEEVLDSPMVADPLHRLDCCVITDGGGALVVVSPEVARDLARRSVEVLGHGEAPKHTDNGRIDLTYTGAAWSGPAGVRGSGRHARRRRLRVDLRLVHHHRARVRSRTSGSARRARAARFVPTARSSRRDGRLPFNTDGGGLCNNHPGNRGGMTKVIEAVRQLRGEAHPDGPGPRLRRSPSRTARAARSAPAWAAPPLVLGQEDA